VEEAAVAAEVVVAEVGVGAAIKEESRKIRWLLQAAHSMRALLRETHRSHSIPLLPSALEEARQPSRLPSFRNPLELRPVSRGCPCY
jgi:hypothetical protein